MIERNKIFFHVSSYKILTEEIYSNKKGVLIINGKIRIGTSTKGVGGELLNISRVISHPNYNHREVDNDIAVIQVLWLKVTN